MDDLKSKSEYAVVPFANTVSGFKGVVGADGVSVIDPTKATGLIVETMINPGPDPLDEAAALAGSGAGTETQNGVAGSAAQVQDDVRGDGEMDVDLSPYLDEPTATPAVWGRDSGPDPLDEFLRRQASLRDQIAITNEQLRLSQYQRNIFGIVGVVMLGIVIWLNQQSR